MKKVIWNAGFFCEAKQLLCVTQKIPFLELYLKVVFKGKGGVSTSYI